jgi:hypothetical protein
MHYVFFNIFLLGSELLFGSELVNFQYCFVNSVWYMFWNSDATIYAYFAALHFVFSYRDVRHAQKGSIYILILKLNIYIFLATEPEVRVRFPALPDFFWEVMGLERGPLSLVMIIEELFQGNSGSGLENRYKRPWGFVALTTKVDFADKRRSLGRYNWLAD